MYYSITKNVPTLPKLYNRVEPVTNFIVVVHHTKYFLTQLILSYYYHPQMKLRKGNVFTPVCQSFCSQGRCTPPGTPPPWQTQPHWEDTPLGIHPQANIHPQADTHPRADTPLGRHTTPGQTPLLPRRPLQRTVRILLECILVHRYLHPQVVKSQIAL